MTSQFWQTFLAAEFSAQRGRALLQALGSFSGDPVEFLEKRAGLTEGERKRIALVPQHALDAAIASGAQVLEEHGYPEALRQTEPSAPPALFAWGNLACLEQPCIGIVGTRNASTYGKACAQKFAEAFAAAGVTVVSGGALGIDAAAHRGALAAGGSTVAILAGGVDHVYPAIHGALFNEIRERGCLISQFAAGSKPNEYKFIVRNSLIAALSSAILVVEAPVRSGAIRTAVAAGELGREVFVVPANVNALSFRGSFNLIRDGCTLVDHPAQVLESLGIEPALELTADAPPSSLGSAILSVLTTNPTATEIIVQKTGLPTSEILSELTMLELEGRVIRASSGYAIKP